MGQTVIGYILYVNIVIIKDEGYIKMILCL